MADPITSAAWEHSERFRRVANGYPRRVALAYDGDLCAASRATDGEVAEHVADWERANGLPVIDWPTVGATERGPDDSEALYALLADLLDHHGGSGSRLHG